MADKTIYDFSVSSSTTSYYEAETLIPTPKNSEITNYADYTEYDGPDYNKIDAIEDDNLVKKCKLVAQEAWIKSQTEEDNSVLSVGDTVVTNATLAGDSILKTDNSDVSMIIAVDGTYIVLDDGSVVKTDDVIKIESGVTTSSSTDSNLTVQTSDLTAVETKDKLDATNRKAGTLPKNAIVCYILNLLTNTKIEFAVLPESISESVTASFDDVQTKARTSPFRFFSAAGPHTYSFTVALFDDYLNESIINVVRKMQALCIPTKSSAFGFVKSPKCLFVLGDFIKVTAVCNSVSVDWNKDAGFKDKKYSHAEVSFDLQEVEDTSRFAEEWEKNFSSLAQSKTVATNNNNGSDIS